LRYHKELAWESTGNCDDRRARLAIRVCHYRVADSVVPAAGYRVREGNPIDILTRAPSAAETRSDPNTPAPAGTWMTCSRLGQRHVTDSRSLTDDEVPARNRNRAASSVTIQICRHIETNCRIGASTCW